MFIRGQLAAFAYQEAAYAGGFACMLAAACVIRNRQRAGWYDGNWMHILNTAANVSAHEGSPSAGIDLSSPLFRRVLQDVDDIYSGTFDDELTGRSVLHPNGAVYFADPERPLRPWFAEKILGDPDNHPRIAQVGNFVFFA
jgi:hypothetical protein